MENPLKSDCFIGKLQSNCNRARLKNVSLKLGFIFYIYCQCKYFGNNEVSYVLFR